MRHGRAREDQSPDYERELTGRGIEDVQENIRAAISRGASPGKVISSPLVRARQTAELVMAELESVREVDIWEELLPSGNPLTVALRLEALDEADAPVLVTHQPFAGELIDYLTGERVGMSTSAIAGISFNIAEQAGSLEWIISD